MRLCNLTDEELAAEARAYRQIGCHLALASHLAPMLEELIDRRAADEQRQLEASFAYEYTSGLIESSCAAPDAEGEWSGWFDLDSIHALDEELAYLDARGLIERHPTNPRWVAIRDESEATA